MRLSVATYERLLGYRVCRVLVTATTCAVALRERLLSNNSYRELKRYLSAWRALRSVHPGTVPVHIIDRAVACTGALTHTDRRGRYCREFLSERSCRAWQADFAGFALEHRVRMRYPRDDGDPLREGDLMILKPPLPGGEKGVLMVKYSPSIGKLVALFDHERLATRYRLVLEPSTWGYQDPDILLYLHLATEVVIQSQYRPDFEHVRSLGHNLIPLRIGAGDWVDPSRFTVIDRPVKLYDAVMVASWLKLKRHELFFAAMRQLGDRIGRVALVGYPARGRQRSDVEAEARTAGVADKIDWYEGISHREVAEILQQARVSLMLSTREGASRAIYESLFCDVPVILTASNIGVNRDHINDHTGIAAEDEQLADAVASVLRDPGRFEPRAWALANTGYANTTRLLQEALREAAARAGEPWTQDILPKVNAPNLRYVSEKDWQTAQPWYEDLPQFLRG